MAGGGGADIDDALINYAISRDSSLSATHRFAALETSLGLLKSLCESAPSHLRLASLARVARDFGARSLAVDALRGLIDVISQHNKVDLSEPFLAPGERFDLIPPRGAISNWVLAAVLEEFERLENFSSFYSGASVRQRLEVMGSLGFASAEMDRRLRLVQMRFGVAKP